MLIQYSDLSCVCVYCLQKQCQPKRNGANRVNGKDDFSSNDIMHSNDQFDRMQFELQIIYQMGIMYFFKSNGHLLNFLGESNFFVQNTFIHKL